ncbi:MAG TPA: chromosomal replication initiator protein DnaA [Solirubrobacteraceae bacterium]|nr:chromosomal replication initiator protein DnaA [Solirubrobacteraceae bacterium]
MATNIEQSWQDIQVALRDRVGERTYGLWLEPLRCVGLDGDTLVLAGPPEVSAWALSRLGGALREASAAVLGRQVAVAVEADEERTARHNTTREPSPAPPANVTEPNPKYTFEQFVIGESNHLAHAAALAVAELPGQAYNPLFIYGPPGLGKTHLLHAIANYVRAFGGGLSVRCATAEEFTNSFLAALASRDTERFKSRFRGVDVLLIDDVQFLERKARSEEELFHTFNALHEVGSQLVVSSDRLPADLQGIEERLRERFAGGLVTDITRPDRATRLAILRKRAHYDAVAITDEALGLIADGVTTNVRALEGALIRVVALGSLERRPLDASLASDVLARHGFTATARTSVDIPRIQAVACAHFGLERSVLLSRSRSANVAWARQAAMYLARELTDHSLPQIGRAFADRDHTTVLHACRRVAREITANVRALADIEALTSELSS